MSNQTNTATVSPFEARVAEARAQKLANRKEANLALLDNEKFLATQVKLADTADEVGRLDIMLMQLNTGITPFIAKDGSKYSVRVFPVSQFGIGLDKLIGIIANSSSAFTDEMAIQYEAIVGVPFTELQIANQVLGSVDYMSKEGIYVEGSRTTEKAEHRALAEEDLTSSLAGLKAEKFWVSDNIDELHSLIQSIAVKLDIYEIVPSREKLADLIAKWEASATRRARKQEEEVAKSTTLNEASEFTID